MSPSKLHRSRSRRIGKACFETLEGRRLLSFTSAAPNSVGTNPRAIVTADFNGDYKLDIATVNAGSINVSVLLGNGSGGFGTSQQFPVTTNTSAQSPSHLVVADFDGDTRADLAVLDGLGIYIFKGNGNGTFQSPVRHGPGAWEPTGLAVGDLNGDHRMDLVYTDSDQLSGIGGSVFVLLNNGQGGFTHWQWGLTPSYGLAVADVNNDGKLDVVTTWDTLLGNGGGTLGAPSQHSGFSDNPDYAPRAIAIGNMTGDNVPDLVSAASTVQVLPGLGNGGFGGNMRAGNATIYYTAVATADFNADGKLDGVATGSTADLYLGNGDGTMRSPVPSTVGTSPAAVAVGDFNGDGRPDFATANAGSNNVSVLLNDGNWATKTFVGPGGSGSGGDWSNAANWSPSGVPAASDVVSITGKSVNLASDATVAGLTLTGGAMLTVAQNGGRMLRTSAITIAAGSKLDLKDNDLIIDYAPGGGSPLGSLNGSVYSGIAGLVQSGHNGGAWNGGNGIITTMPGALAGRTALGIAEASAVLGINGSQSEAWNGFVVDATTVLVKYTYAGDGNLDGIIDGGDYGIIDNFAQVPGAWDYFNGDFNFDGVIDGGDYGIIDNNIQAQGAPL